MPDTQTPQTVVLQQLSLPEPGLPGPDALWLTVTGGGVTDGGVTLADGGRADFGTWINLVNLTNWQRLARLDGLLLRLAGRGRVTVTLRQGAQALPDRVVDLTPDGVTLDLAPLLPAGGLLRLALTATGPAHLAGGAFLTRAAAPRPVRLAIGITTFRREDAVTDSARRLSALIAQAGRIAAAGLPAHLFVIDNGQSLAPLDLPHVTLIPNRNLGGAGGFARALAAAQDGGFTHCLFMDDDARFPLENLTRTLALLRLARADNTALAGAMLSEARPAEMWEYGALFHRACRPQGLDAALTDPAEVDALEALLDAPQPRALYGGWWYFAFPLAGLRHWPFPFFVRGDDISFSLANRFALARLNGVMSWQEDFGVKQSPQTLYLDLRNHLHHHLVQEGMEIGARATAAMALRFILRAVVRMHYASAEAQLMAWEDAMTGPQLYLRTLDMTATRARIAAFSGSEAWVPLAAPQTAPPLVRKPGTLWEQALKFTLNGHLIPFFGRFGARVTVPLEQRALIWPLWGAAAVRFVDADAGRSYAVAHDKRRAGRIIARALRLSWAWMRAYPGLRARYRAAYPAMTARPFWEDAFAGRPPVLQPALPPALPPVLPPG